MNTLLFIKRLRVLVIVALAAGLMLGERAAITQAASHTFTVNNSLDAPDANPGNGICETASGNGICTLRAAIQEANALAGANTITLSAQTYTLTIQGFNEDNSAQGDLDIKSNLTINGAGAGSTIIDGNSIIISDRVLDIHNGVVTISGVTMKNGSAHDGGGIENNGTLTLNSSAVTGSTAYAYGGGINNHGTLTLNSSLVSGNTDIGPTANGGGIFNGNMLTVVNSTLKGNTAGGGGGAIANFGTATFTNSTLSGNSGPYGGGIRNGYHMALTKSTLSNNTAAASGGGLYNESQGVAAIADSTLSGNISAVGGGIENRGMLTVTTSTLSGNNATGAGKYDGGGALDNYYGTATLANSTLTANSARQNGGAIYNNSGTTNLSNATIYANIADVDDNNLGDGGGIYNVNVAASVVNIKNSIAATNWRSLVGGPVQDCYGWLNSGDYNLFQNVVSCNFNGATIHNKIAGPVLGQLQNNGGATQTNALNPGSPAIDAGDPNGCTDTFGATLATDQRGYSRPAGAACDMGAFESGAALPKQNQAIIWGQLPNQMMSAAPFQINATASSGLKIDFSAVGECSVSASNLNQGLSSATVTLSGKGGDCTITAHQAGSATYNAAADVVRTFAITTQNQTISFAPLPDKTLGDPSFTVSATASSGLPVSLTPNTPQVCDVIGNTVTLKSSGICELLAEQDGNNQFAPAPNVQRSFAVLDPVKQAQTITFAALPNRTLGDPPFQVSATASSGLAVTFKASGKCAVSGTSVTLSGQAGSCTIVAAQAGDSSYNAAPVVSRSFAINSPAKQNQAISFGALPNRTLGDAPFSLSATASSGLPVGFSSGTPAACTVSGTTVTLLSAGTCTIIASQDGNGGFNAAADVTQSFLIANNAPPAPNAIVYLPITLR